MLLIWVASERGSTLTFVSCTDANRIEPNHSQCSTIRCQPTHETIARDAGDGPTRDGAGRWLLRKEVIQPHLPVRLPCYDLVLITGPTFDGSLHEG